MQAAGLPIGTNWPGHGLAAVGRAALFHAGWLVQAQLGMELTWSWFGGLGGVAVWWLLLALGTGRRGRPGQTTVRTAAGVAAVGLALAMILGRSPLGLLGWAGHVAAWAWLCSRWLPACGLSEPPGGPGTTAAARIAGMAGLLGGMLLAAWLAADPTEWTQRWPWLAALLLLAPWLGRAAPARGPVQGWDLPMGLMMASVLPMTQGCSALGWSAFATVMLHWVAMAAGALAAWALPAGGGPPSRPVWLAAVPLCLWDSPWAMAGAAALVALASSGAGPTLARAPIGAFFGAALLLAAGAWTASAGPDALRWALACALLLCALWPAGARSAQRLA